MQVAAEQYHGVLSDPFYHGRFSCMFRLHITSTFGLDKTVRQLQAVKFVTF